MVPCKETGSQLWGCQKAQTWLPLPRLLADCLSTTKLQVSTALFSLKIRFEETQNHMATGQMGAATVSSSLWGLHGALLSPEAWGVTGPDPTLCACQVGESPTSFFKTGDKLLPPPANPNMGQCSVQLPAGARWPLRSGTVLWWSLK